MLRGKLKRWALVNVLVSGSVLALSGQWTSPILWTFVLGIAGLTLYAMTATTSDLMNERFHPPSRGRDPVALLWIRQIGRASCRERVGISVVGVSIQRECTM